MVQPEQKETVKLPPVADSQEPNSNPEPLKSPEAPSSTPSQALRFQVSYLRDIIPGINMEVQLLNWTMTKSAGAITQSLNLAHPQIIGLQKTVNGQATSIASLIKTITSLQHKPAPPPLALPTRAKERRVRD